MSIVGSDAFGFVEPQPWTADALCAQVGWSDFYPNKGESRKVKAAKRVCDACAVVEQCLAYALENGERHGIWGSKTERERRRLRPNEPVKQLNPADCGTSRQYRAHLRRGEDCVVCRRASNRVRNEREQKRRGAA